MNPATSVNKSKSEFEMGSPFFFFDIEKKIFMVEKANAIAT